MPGSPDRREPPRAPDGPAPLADLFRDRMADASGVRISADGAWILALRGDDQAFLCDGADARVVRQLAPDRPGRWLLPADGHGAGALHAGDGGGFTWWGGPAFAEIAAFEGLEGRLTCWTEVPGLGAVAAGTDAGAVGLWRSGTRSPLRAWRLDAPVAALGLVDGGARLAAASAAGRCEAWDLAGEAPATRIHAPEGHWTWGFPAGGHRLLGFRWNGEDGEVWVWDLPDGTLRYRRGDLGIDPRLPVVSPDGRYFAIASGEDADAIRVHALLDGEPVATLEGRGLQFAFTPDGRHLVDVDWDLRAWDTSRFAPAATCVDALASTARAFGMSADGRLLAIAPYDAPLRLFDLGAMAFRPHGPGLAFPVEHAALDPDRGAWTTLGADGLLVWPLDGAVRPVRRPLPGLNPIALSPTGSHLVAEVDGMLGLWDVAGDAWVARVATPGRPWNGWHAAIAPDLGTVAFLCDTDEFREPRPVRRWDVRTGAVATSPGGVRLHHALAIDPAGRLLAATAAPGTVGLWDLATGSPAAQLRSEVPGSAFEADWRSLAFHPRRPWLVAVGKDDRVRIWDLGTRALVAERAFASAFAAAWSEDGGFLAVTTREAVILLRDLAGPVLHSLGPPGVLAAAPGLLAVGPRLYRLGPP